MAKSESDDVRFGMSTPLGFTVRSTASYWRPTVRVKHPIMRRHQGRQTGVAQVKAFHDRRGNTLTVWFDDPEQEYSCQETGNEIVLMKDLAGNVIGLEKLNYPPSDSEPFDVAFSASEPE